MQPSEIGPYLIVRQLGTGGMGMVFEAIHKTIKRRVAIKVLFPEYAQDPEIARRFNNEARTANLIEHPGIIQISDTGRDAAVGSYHVMELLRGESLSKRLSARRQNRVTTRQILTIARQIADVLVATHAKGIVHRDLKPDNIMLVPEPVAPEGERVKLLDFGIAKVAQFTSGKTGSKLLMGTPEYMSPEQCRGAGEVDEKTDSYGLGALLFEMFAGRPPFTASDHINVMSMQLHSLAPPLHEYAPNAPPAACALVRELLRKDKQRRPMMREVVRRLDEMLATLNDAPRLESAARAPALAEVSEPSHEPPPLPAPPQPGRKRQRLPSRPPGEPARLPGVPAKALEISGAEPRPSEKTLLLASSLPRSSAWNQKLMPVFIFLISCMTVFLISLTQRLCSPVQVLPPGTPPEKVGTSVAVRSGP